MCLPNFERFDQINKEKPLIGYRAWKNIIEKDSLELKSECMNYIWKSLEGPHEITESNSGIYAYNHYNYNYNNYYNYNYNDYYNLAGIIYQWGKIAVHRIGQRSEYATIDKLFTIRESDAQGPPKFLDWIKAFNSKVEKIAEKYNCKTIHYQDITK